jgi:two-component system invasion response regulator UvrY
MAVHAAGWLISEIRPIQRLMIKLLLVDDHELVRAGLRAILENAGDMQVIGEASDGAEAVKCCRDQFPDVVLMDIRMPEGMGGIEATRRVLRQDPAPKVIVLTSLADDPLPNQLHDAGALGYLTKGCPARELLEAVRTVYRGRPYIDAKLAQRLALGRRDGPESPFQHLSPREMQVLMMILDGRRNVDIANELNKSQKTVSTHRQRIYAKLGVETDVELTRLALRFGLIVDGE